MQVTHWVACSTQQIAMWWGFLLDCAVVRGWSWLRVDTVALWAPCSQQCLLHHHSARCCQGGCLVLGCYHSKRTPTAVEGASL
jgi:hypothetical protein